MDPTANLKEQLQIAKAILKTWDDCNADGTLTMAQTEWISNQSERLAELVMVLHGWITKGGFLPEQWRKK
jgi:hypothetical protein